MRNITGGNDIEGGHAFFEEWTYRQWRSCCLVECPWTGTGNITVISVEGGEDSAPGT